MERLTGKGAKSLKEAYAKVYIEEQIKVPDYASMSDEEFAELVKKSGNPEGLDAKRLQQRKAAANEKVGANYTADDAKADQERAKTEAENKRRESRGENPLPVPQGSKNPPASTSKPTPTSRKQELNAINADKNLTPMQKWEKANPKLAIAKRERDRVRGTAQSDNPMLDRSKTAPSLRSRMPLNSPSIQSSEVSKLGSGFQRLKNNPNAFRGASSTTGSSSPVVKTTSTVKPIKVQPFNANQQSSLNSTVKSSTASTTPVQSRISAIQARRQELKNNPITVSDKVTGSSNTYKSGQKLSSSDSKLVRDMQSQIRSGSKQVPTGDTIKTKVNRDSSMSVTQKRDPKVTANIKKSLELSSVDLFDIVKGEFIEEGYSEEDTMYMMANLDENILRKLVIDPIIRAGRPLVTKGLQRVGKMFGRSPKPTRIPAGDIGAMRLRQGQATDAVNRLNQSTAASKANDATRAAAREKTRLNNLDPRAVSDRNAREAASQVRQRNVEMGRPSWYNPNTPGSKEALKRYYADKRSGVKGLPE